MSNLTIFLAPKNNKILISHISYSNQEAFKALCEASLMSFKKTQYHAISSLTFCQTVIS